MFNEDTPVLEGLEPKEVPLAGQAFEVSAPADIYTLNYRRATQFAVQTIRQERGLDAGTDTEADAANAQTNGHARAATAAPAQ